MGIISDINRDVAAAFNTDLSDAVHTFTLQSSNTDYNPISGLLDSGAILSSGSWRGVFSGLTREMINDNNAKPADTVVIALISEAPFEPVIGNVIFFNSQEFKILSIEKDPTFTVYSMACINSSL